MRVATTTQRRISGPTCRIAPGGNPCPVISHVAQSDVRGVAHDDHLRPAAAFGDRHGATRRSQCRIVTPARKTETLAPQRRGIPPAVPDIDLRITTSGG